jgi:carboxypeptidase A2
MTTGFKASLAALLAVATVTDPSSAVAAPPSVAARPYRDHLWVKTTPRNQADLDRIWAIAEEVIAPHDPALVPHDLVVSRSTLAALRAGGLPAEFPPIDVEAWVALSYQKALEAPAVVPFHAGKLGIYGTFFAKVQDLEATTAYLRELEQASAGRAQLVTLGMSHQGRPIVAMRLSTAPRGADRPAVIVLGTQHAREWASPMVAMGLIDGLVRQYDSDPRVRAVVDNLEVWIVPVTNPDGYVATFAGRRLQRKNMNPTCNVDLNRNYDGAFGMGVSDSCSSQTYPGPAAFSEPESQAVNNLVKSLKRPKLFMDYHSTAAQVMIPYAFTTMRPPGYEKNRAFCELYSSTLRTLNGTSHPARPGYNLGRGSGGGALDWFRMHHAESIVVELGGGPAFDIQASAIVPVAEENFVAWLAVAGEVVKDNGGVVADGGATLPDAGAVADATPRPADTAARPVDALGATADAGAPAIVDARAPVDVAIAENPVDANAPGFAGGADAAPAPPPTTMPRPPATNSAGCRIAGDGARAAAPVPFVLMIVGASLLRRRRRPL